MSTPQDDAEMDASVLEVLAAVAAADAWDAEHATDCIDRDGAPWPEHDYGEYECRRCGAEAPEEDQ